MGNKINLVLCFSSGCKVEQGNKDAKEDEHEGIGSHGCMNVLQHYHTIGGLYRWIFDVQALRIVMENIGTVKLKLIIIFSPSTT